LCDEQKYCSLNAIRIHIYTTITLTQLPNKKLSYLRGTSYVSWNLVSCYTAVR